MNIFRQCHGVARSLICIFILVPLGLLGAFVGSSAKDFSKGFPNGPDFFPIGVWLQSPARASSYKALGINTYVGLWKGPTQEQLATLSNASMFVIAAQNDVALHSPYQGIVKGWLHDDEPDNAQPIGMGLYGSCIPATEVVRRTQEMKARDHTRPVVINFGQGIANPYWRGRGPCNGDEDYYSIASQGVDILSFDIYPVASKTPQVKGKLEYVARGVSHLKKLATDDQTVWTTIETTALDPGHPVSPAQVRAEVWMAIIHGARGIVYFVHEFKPTFREDAIFRHPDVVSEVAKENGLIRSLAAVINGPSPSEKVSVQSTVPIATMIKRSKSAIYIFAVAMADSPSKPRFTLNRPDVTDAAAIGEGRDVSISHASFEDAFDGYGVHIYRIPVTNAKGSENP